MKFTPDLRDMTDWRRIKESILIRRIRQIRGEFHRKFLVFIAGGAIRFAIQSWM
jgi:hypothetical protein